MASGVPPKSTGTISEKTLPAMVTSTVFDPNEIAEPKTLLIELFSMVMPVGGFTGSESPQTKMPYDKGDELPPPGRRMLLIELLANWMFDAPGLTVIPLPTNSLPTIVKFDTTTLSGPS